MLKQYKVIKTSWGGAKATFGTCRLLRYDADTPSRAANPGPVHRYKFGC